MMYTDVKFTLLGRNMLLHLCYLGENNISTISAPESRKLSTKQSKNNPTIIKMTLMFSQNYFLAEHIYQFISMYVSIILM